MSPGIRGCLDGASLCSLSPLRVSTRMPTPGHTHLSLHRTSGTYQPGSHKRRPRSVLYPLNQNATGVRRPLPVSLGMGFQVCLSEYLHAQYIDADVT